MGKERCTTYTLFSHLRRLICKANSRGLGKWHIVSERVYIGHMAISGTNSILCARCKSIHGKPPKRGRINQRRDSSKRIEPGKVRFCFFIYYSLHSDPLGSIRQEFHPIPQYLWFFVTGCGLKSSLRSDRRWATDELALSEMCLAGSQKQNWIFPGSILLLESLLWLLHPLFGGFP